MPKFPFNYCVFLAMLLCSTVAFGFNLQQSLVAGCVIFAAVFVSFVVVFLVQQLMSTQLLQVLYMFFATIAFLFFKLLMKKYMIDIYDLVATNFDYLLIPTLLSGVLIDYSLDDKNAVPITKQFFSIVGVMFLNIVSFSILGFLRELLAYGTVWGKYLTSATSNFFATPAFSLFYIAMVFGAINSLLIRQKVIKKRYALYVDKMEDSLKAGRLIK